MKRFSSTVIAAAMIMLIAVSASAVPKLQTYITDSRYHYWYNNLDHFSWVSNSQQFDLNVIGYWGPSSDIYSGGSAAGIFRGVAGARPEMDYMDTFLSIVVPQNQSGTVWINGVEVTSFERYFSALPDGTRPAWYLPLSTPNIYGRYNFQDIGRLTNQNIVDWHYGFSDLTTPGWGDQREFNVVVDGFDWVNFDAIGIDSNGRTITNTPYHDSSYFATPEPGTLSLIGLGLIGIIPLVRKKK